MVRKLDSSAMLAWAATWLSESLQCMFYLVPPERLALTKGEKVPNLIAKHGFGMFLLMIATEIGVGTVVAERSLYRFNDLLASISSGTCQQLVVALLSKFADPKAAYRLVNDTCRLVDFDVKGKPLATWICLFLGALQPMMTWIFSLPLALVFPAESILIHAQLNMMYQFWIHTELCGRLGILEIIWDRLFSTYEAETERLDYFGLAQPAGTFNVVELNLQHWRKMGRFHLLRGGCFWHLLRSSVSKRAHHQFLWTPGQLVQKYAAMLEDKSSWSLPEKEVRPKYRGADLQIGKAAAIAMYLGGFVCLQRADKPEQRAKLQLLCAAAGGFTWLQALGDFLDKGYHSWLGGKVTGNLWKLFGSMDSFIGPLASVVNPLSFSFPMWLASVVVKEVVLQAADLGVTCACSFLKELPSRTGDKVLYKNQLDKKDMLFLSMNSVIEAVFTCHILNVMWSSPVIFRSWSSFGILTGPLALLLTILLNDMFYAPAHRLLHHPSIYPYIHKHHHRSVYPTRGNIDARNEHPVEQLIAMFLWMCAVQITAHTVGLHAAALGTHLALMATGASLNHAGFDFEVRFLGVDWFSTGAHEMHHRRPDRNFGQFTMLWDKLMGTYIPYDDGSEPAKRRLEQKAD
eukprot:s3091_g6.t3